MKCFHPVSIPNPKYIWDDVCKPNPRNKDDWLTVPCGKCPACKSNLADEWSIRCIFEEKYSIYPAYFCTLTYNDDSLPFTNEFNPTLVKSDIQKFFKRLRKHLGKGIKYFACGEYGGKTFRPHYHFILFHCPLDTKGLLNIIKKSWKFADIFDVQLSGNGCYHYVTKYMIKSFFDLEIYTKISSYDKDFQPPFRLMSQGLGLSYIEDANIYLFYQQTLKSFIQYGKRKYRMPRYYKEKLFDKLQRDRISEESAHQIELQEARRIKQHRDDYLRDSSSECSELQNHSEAYRRLLSISKRRK